MEIKKSVRFEGFTGTECSEKIVDDFPSWLQKFE